jgi:hypothetical protein
MVVGADGLSKPVKAGSAISDTMRALAVSPYCSRPFAVRISLRYLLLVDGCCQNGTNCGIWGGKPGCCPVGETCVANDDPCIYQGDVPCANFDFCCRELSRHLQCRWGDTDAPL